MMYQEEHYPDLERAPEGCRWQVPFVVVAYIPTVDGIMVDLKRPAFREPWRSYASGFCGRCG